MSVEEEMLELGLCPACGCNLWDVVEINGVYSCTNCNGEE